MMTIVYLKEALYVLFKIEQAETPLPFAGSSLVSQCVCLSHSFWNSAGAFCSGHSALPGGSRCLLPSSSVEGALQTASILPQSWSLFPSSAFSLFIKQIEKESNRTLHACTLLRKTGKGFTSLSWPGESQPVVQNGRFMCSDYPDTAPDLHSAIFHVDMIGGLTFRFVYVLIVGVHCRMIICVSEVYSLDASNILQTVTSNAVSRHG